MCRCSGGLNSWAYSGGKWITCGSPVFSPKSVVTRGSYRCGAPRCLIYGIRPTEREGQERGVSEKCHPEESRTLKGEGFESPNPCHAGSKPSIGGSKDP